MDRPPSRRPRRAFLVPLVAWFATFLLALPASATAAQPGDLDAWASAFPTAMEQDLAAMALLPADYPVPGLVVGNGRLWRPTEEAAAHAQALDLTEADLLARMRDAGWIVRYIGEVGPGTAPAPGVVPTTGWSSITAYENAAGAAEGFALLDESRAEGATLIPARRIGDAARLTRYTGTDNAGRPFDRLRYTFVSGPLVGAVALIRGTDTPEAAMTPEAMVTMAERLLARMGAASAAPGMPALVLRLNPTAALPISSHEEGYYVVEGELIAHQGNSAQAIAAAQRFDRLYGVDANYIMHTTFDGQVGVDHRPTWLVALYRVRDADAATDLVRQHARYDLSVGYDELTELDALPAVDWPAAGSAYTEAWPDGSQSQGYRITVAVGGTLVIVDASAPGGVSQEVAFALVEAQVACLELGSCAPLAAPFAPVTAPNPILSTPSG